MAMSFRRSRKFFRRRINGKLSRKHYTWITAFNSPCDQVKFSHCEPTEPEEDVWCCPSDGHLVLLSNTVLESSFQDTAKVVKILGQLRWAWDVNEVLNLILVLAGENCNLQRELTYGYLAAFQGCWRSGIAKRQVVRGNTTSFQQLNPLDSYDFSEGQWKLMKFHEVMPDNMFTLLFNCGFSHNQNGVCADVVGASPGATTTTCTAFTLPDVVIPDTFGQTLPVQQMRSWVTSYNNRVKFSRLRENEELVLSFGWSMVDSTNGQLPPPSLLVQGGLKLLIEVG